MVYVNPRVIEPEKNYWGEREGAIKKYGAIFEGVKPHNRDRNYREHLMLLKEFKPTGKLLDIGTFHGFFLRLARGQGWELYGVEPSPTASALAREKFGLNVFTGYLHEANFEKNFFDIVTIIDVFEHVTQPLDLLGEIRRILKDDGVLFIKTAQSLLKLTGSINSFAPDIAIFAQNN